MSLTAYVIAALALALAIAVGAGAFFYNRWDAADTRADQAEAALIVEKANEKVVTKFVEQKVEVIRRVPVIRERLVRLCDNATVSGAGNPDGTTVVEARDGIAGLSEEIGACLIEAKQLAALQEVVRGQQ